MEEGERREEVRRKEACLPCFGAVGDVQEWSGLALRLVAQSPVFEAASEKNMLVREEVSGCFDSLYHLVQPSIIYQHARRYLNISTYTYIYVRHKSCRHLTEL